jgi:hypothetical protein
MLLAMKALKYITIFFMSIFALIGIITIAAYFAIYFKWTTVSGLVDSNDRYLAAVVTPSQKPTIRTDWINTEEWKILKAAIVKDTATINTVAQFAEISPRLIVAPLVVEQLRLFSSQRETFKEIFKPLQILGIQSQFSWGVMGLKQETAIKIEQNLKNPQSIYYLDPSFENSLDFKTQDFDTERFDRIVAKDHYYSYLYTALYFKQIIAQWQKSGFDIENKPEILATLFNIGFEHSNPNPTPQSGGAEIEVNGQKYSFGELAHAFYYSDELLTEFPR